MSFRSSDRIFQAGSSRCETWTNISNIFHFRAMERVGEARGFGLLHNALLDSTTSFSPPHQSLPPNLLDEIGDLKFCNGALYRLAF